MMKYHLIHIGSWDDCKYAVLIPFEDIPNEKIACAEPMDTFTRGSIELPKSAWILCPQNEVEKMKVYNPNVHVLGYEGDRVLGFSQPFLTQLGYRAEKVGMWSWENDESSNEFSQLMKKEQIKRGTHTYTYFHEDEQLLLKINAATSLCKLLRDNHLIDNPESASEIMKQLEDKHMGFNALLADLGEKSGFSESELEPQAIVGNHKQAGIFIEEMYKNGFVLSKAYEDVIRNICEVSIHDCNEKNEDTIFNISKEATEEEKNNINNLKSVLASKEYRDASEKSLAFGKFISAAVCDSIIYSKERINSKDKSDEERL